MGREVAELYQGQPMLAFPDPAAWEKWLAAEQAGFSGLWLKLAKKGCPDTTVSYAEALDVALCFGWIDGQKRPLDDDYWLQRFTPRKPGSKWSKINRGKAEALIAAGRMRPPASARWKRPRLTAAGPPPTTGKAPRRSPTTCARPWTR